MLWYPWASEPPLLWKRSQPEACIGPANTLSWQLGTKHHARVLNSSKTDPKFGDSTFLTKNPPCEFGVDILNWILSNICSSFALMIQPWKFHAQSLEVLPVIALNYLCSVQKMTPACLKNNPYLAPRCHIFSKSDHRVQSEQRKETDMVGEKIPIQITFESQVRVKCRYWAIWLHYTLCKFI